MSRVRNVIISIVITSFIAFNIFLLFNKESVISKTLYVSEFERLQASSFTEEIPKEGFVSPLETSTIYVGDEDEVEDWLVSEGQEVEIGDELVLLNTERSNEERDLLNTKQQALLQQKSEIESLLADLNRAQSSTGTGNSSTVNRDENITEVDGTTQIELGFQVDFTVDVTQEGSYAQAQAAAEQQLAEVATELTIVEAELAVDPSKSVIISPVTGVVSKIVRHGSKLAIDIYSTEKVIKTFAKDNEWKAIEEGDRVILQGPGLDNLTEGFVVFVSQLPTTDNELIDAYKKIDKEEATNPLAYYEVAIVTPESLAPLPYGNNVNSVIVIDEAKEAVALNESWVTRSDKDTAKGKVIDKSGRAVTVELTTPFMDGGRVVITDGLASGQIVFPMPMPTGDIHKGSPKVFLKMPTDMPKKEEWQSITWQQYLKYMIMK